VNSYISPVDSQKGMLHELDQGSSEAQ